MEYYKPMQHLQKTGTDVTSSFYVVLKWSEKLILWDTDTSDNSETIYIYRLRVDSTERPFYDFNDENTKTSCAADHNIIIEIYDSKGTTLLGKVTNNSDNADVT